MNTSLLFSPLRMRDVQLANRIVVSPMAQYSAIDGVAGDWHLMHVGNLAISGVGLMILEATAVEPRGRVSPYCLGLWSDAHEAALCRIVEFCKRNGGSPLGLQLAHSGRKGSVGAPWEGQAEIPPSRGGWSNISPSDVAYAGRTSPHAVSPEEMEQVKQMYATATTRAARIGFDTLELHCAHGYLLHSFLSPLSNTRTDAYGGSLDDRMRYPLEVFRAVRDAWPAHKPLGVRISATDWVAGGWMIEDSVQFARALQALGCDYICCSGGGTSVEQKAPVGPGYQLPYAERIRREVGIVTMGVGLITDPVQAESAITEGSCDLVAMGRAMLYQPRWAWQAAERFGVHADFPRQYARAHPSMRNRDFHRAVE